MNTFLITLMVLYTIATAVWLIKTGVEFKTEGTCWTLIAVLISSGLLGWTIYIYNAQAPCQ
jgi:hypothetical protein